jgi:diaminopimelate epimerase
MIATYGHGTENDFVLVFDPNDEHSITTAQTAAICDRKSGIGADGLIKHLRVPLTDDISVNMGQVTDEGEAITAATNGHIWNGYNISVGNPHAVVFVDDMAQIGELNEAPVVRPRDSYPEGVNVEFVKITEGNSIQMRVFERGSGETRSCGTGTCAVALAATLHTKGKLPATWIINPPGGRLEVSIDGHSNATLTGPAVLIKDVDISRFLLE